MIGEKCENLQYIQFEYYPGLHLPESELEWVRTKFQKLQSVRLFGTSKNSADQMGNFLARLPSVKELGGENLFRKNGSDQGLLEEKRFPLDQVELLDFFHVPMSYEQFLKIGETFGKNLRLT